MRARSSASALSRLLNASNVVKLNTGVKKKASEGGSLPALLPAAARAIDELGCRSRNADRLKTATATQTLVERLVRPTAQS